jgi:enamine deaminase RidA (YjgF/YER057c/UK114 family)
MGKIDERLSTLGITLPEVPAPVAAYVPAVQTGSHVVTSGQLPLVAGKLLHTGKVGGEVSVEQGAACARQCALNALAAVKALIGDLDRVERVVKINGWVACPDDFTDQPKVINGASLLIGEIFGDAGKHARAAVGANALPLGAPVELELIVRVR